MRSREVGYPQRPRSHPQSSLAQKYNSLCSCECLSRDCTARMKEARRGLEWLIGPSHAAASISTAFQKMVGEHYHSLPRETPLLSRERAQKLHQARYSLSFG